MQPETLETIIQWPDPVSGGLEGMTSDKVPTEIQYVNEGYKWGFHIPDVAPRHHWFKLGLDSSQSVSSSDLANQYPDTKAALSDSTQTPEMLTIDFLTAIRKHAEIVLEQKLPASVYSTTSIEYIIAVPAVWSEAAQAKTRTCAEKAGLGEGTALHIISEPEAAAVYSMHIMDPHGIRTGDTFVLCDAGGGTVDLISYRVTRLKPILQVKEVVPGSGSQCGSTFLNRIFQRFLIDKLGGLSSWDDEVLEEAMKKFESTVKRAFTGSAEEEYQILVPGLSDSPSLGVRRGRFLLTGSDVRAIFEPVVKEVKAHVMRQVDATETQGFSVKTVLLVGGFGQSAYLRDSIRQMVAPKGIQVLQSLNGWTAVVRGALMKRLASAVSDYSVVKISGRSARKYYGAIISKTFNADVHDIEKRFWNPYNGMYQVHVMDWFIKKGDTIVEQKPKRLEYFTECLVSDGRPRTIGVNINKYLNAFSAVPPLYEDGKSS
ncbi:MAG: hypothetical protein Q9167_005457 [Letrouitia subvulpina]